MTLLESREKSFSSRDKTAETSSLTEFSFPLPDDDHPFHDDDDDDDDDDNNADDDDEDMLRDDRNFRRLYFFCYSTCHQGSKWKRDANENCEAIGVTE